MTDVANKHSKLDQTDVDNCYDKEYHTGPYATHHSTGTTSSFTNKWYVMVESSFIP